MTSRVPQMGPRTEEEQVVEFSVNWLRLCELPFGIAIQVRLGCELHKIGKQYAIAVECA